MPTIETAIRLIVIGQEFLIAAVFLFGNGARAARISGTLLVLSIAGHLYVSDIVLRNSIPLLEPVAVLLALIVPYCLWLFARAVFDAPWPKPVLMVACALVGITVWGVYLADEALNPIWMSAANIVMHILALMIVAHALWLTMRGRPDDLIERRRTFRLFFVVIVAIQVTAVLLVELTLGGTAPPAWLERTNIIIIAILTIGLAIPMLRLNSEFFEPEPGSEAAGTKDEANAPGAVGTILRKKLLDLMDAGYHRETGLTIRVLAEKLNYPEHQLRRLINGRLGFRNFSAFLNSYRISEAKKQLADPERARTQVLTIALDLGYASLGPFNRAFKAATGMTPTEYRQNNLSLTGADFE